METKSKSILSYLFFIFLFTMIAPLKVYPDTIHQKGTNTLKNFQELKKEYNAYMAKIHRQRRQFEEYISYKENRDKQESYFRDFLKLNYIWQISEFKSKYDYANSTLLVEKDIPLYYRRARYDGLQDDKLKVVIQLTPKRLREIMTGIGPIKFIIEFSLDRDCNMIINSLTFEHRGDLMYEEHM